MIRRWDKSKPPTGPWTLNKDAPQAQGLVAWYPMGGPSARGYAADLAGQLALSGTVSSSVLGADGQPATSLNGSSEFLLNSSGAPVSDVPLTLASWANAGSSSLVGSLLAVDFGQSTGGNNRFHRLVVVGSASPKQVRANSGWSGGLETQATHGAGWVAGTWFHTVGVFASQTSRAVYYNGALGATDTTSATTGTVNKIQYGRHSVTGSEQHWNGGLGEAGVWNLALNAEIVRRLYSPDTRYELWYPLRSKKWFSAGSAGISATLTGTLAAATVSSTGTVALKGALTGTLAAATAAATGTVALKGTLSKTLDAATLSATATLALTGTTTQTLADATLAATGALAVTGSGTLTATLAGATLDSTATLALKAATSATLDAATLAATSTLAIKGATTATLDAATLSAQGTSQTVTVGVLSQTLADASVASTGTLALRAQASPTLDAATLVSTSTLAIKAVATATLGDATLASTATVLIKGSATITLGACTIVSTVRYDDPNAIFTTSEHWRYTFPVDDMRYAMPVDDMRHTFPSGGLTYNFGE